MARRSGQTLAGKCQGRPAKPTGSPSLECNADITKIELDGHAQHARRGVLFGWQGLTRFIDFGCIEIDNNVVEGSIRPIALNCKNALQAPMVVASTGP